MSVTVNIQTSPQSNVSLMLFQTRAGAVVIVDIAAGSLQHCTSVIDTEYSRAELWNEIAKLDADPHARAADMVARCAEALLLLARYGVVKAE